MVLPLAVGVWLPDVVSARRNVLAKQQLTNGYSFQVIQYWNHVEFYSTALVVVSPDGSNKIHILNGDDSKKWRMQLAIDEQKRTATVLSRGRAVRVVDW